MSWGKFLWASAIILGSVAIADQVSPELGMAVAIVSLLALFLHNSKALAELLSLIPQGV